MHENQRLVNQQGIFTFIEQSRDGGFRTVEEYLSRFTERFSSEIDNDTLLLQITIPSSERIFILEQLDLMNINAATLFPDLIGLAHYCNYLLEEEIRGNR